MNLNVVQVETVRHTLKGLHVIFDTPIHKWMPARPPRGVVYPVVTARRRYHTKKLFFPYWYSLRDALAYIASPETVIDMVNMVVDNSPSYDKVRQKNSHGRSWMRGAPYTSLDKGHGAPMVRVNVYVCPGSPGVPGYVGLESETYTRVITTNAVDSSIILCTLKACMFAVEHHAKAGGGRLVLGVGSFLCYQMLTDSSTPRTSSENKVIRRMYQQINNNPDVSVVIVKANEAHNLSFIRSIMAMKTVRERPDYDERFLAVLRTI